MSDFYTCFGTKQKKYLKERRGQELNDEKQQEVVDKQLAEQFGLEEQATAFTRLAKRVVSQIGESPVPDILKSSVNAPTISIKDKLGSLIESGTLSTWFDKISKITDTKGLSKAAKVVLGDIKNPETRSQITEAFNDKATEIINRLGDIDESVKAVEQAFIDTVAGGNTGALEQLSQRYEGEDTMTVSSSLDLVEKIPIFDKVGGSLQNVINKLDPGETKSIPLFDKTNDPILYGKNPVTLVLGSDGLSLKQSNNFINLNNKSNVKAMRGLPNLDLGRLTQDLVSA